MIDNIHKRFRNYPFARKLTAVIMLASLLVVVLSFSLFVLLEVISFWKLEQEKLMSMADIIGQNSTAAITFGDAKAAEETLSGLRNNPHILVAYIENADGNLFAEYRNEDNPRKDIRPLSGKTGGSPKSSTHRPSGEGISVWEVSRQIVMDNQVIGRIVIQSDRDELIARLGSFLLVSGLILLSAFLFSFFISRKLQHLVSQPILEILQTMRSISNEKKYSLRVAKRSEDELGALAQGFNEMLDQIQLRDEELEKELGIRKRAEEQIRRLAYYDSLTGLPNRTFFQELMSKALEQAERHKQTMAVLYMDLDNFKRINDSLGHALGDKLLQVIPNIVLRCIRKSDIFARHREDEILEAMSRLGGDEFIILLNVINKSEEAAIIARRILTEMRDPISVDGNQIYCTASIGIAIFPQDGKDASTLLKCADMAMYHAKAEGKNNFQFFAESMNIAVQEKLKMENDLRRALEKGEFILHYHPKMDASRNKLIGMEALLRWQHPERGLVAPSDFIPVAEESGLIVQVDEWVLRTACLQHVAWQKAGYIPQHISVNLSCRQFEEIGMVDSINKILQHTQLDPRYLELEITESTIMKNPDMAITLLQDLISLGIQISVDDFGTGYSSLSYLRRLPLTTLKIDRSFIRELPFNQDDVSIVKAIIALAHSLRLKVVAEGVETAAQRDFLLGSGCDGMQGFFWHRPLSADEITTILDRETP